MTDNLATFYGRQPIKKYEVTGIPLFDSFFSDRPIKYTFISEEITASREFTKICDMHTELVYNVNDRVYIPEIKKDVIITDVILTCFATHRLYECDYEFPAIYDHPNEEEAHALVKEAYEKQNQRIKELRKKKAPWYTKFLNIGESDD